MKNNNNNEQQLMNRQHILELYDKPLIDYADATSVEMLVLTCDNNIIKVTKFICLNVVV